MGANASEQYPASIFAITLKKYALIEALCLPVYQHDYSQKLLYKHFYKYLIGDVHKSVLSNFSIGSSGNN
jgi:hypothetical protein